MTFDMSHYLSSHDTVQCVSDGLYRAEIWMSPQMTGTDLQARLDELTNTHAASLSFTVHGVRDFDSVANLVTSRTIPGLFPCETWEGSIQYYFPQGDSSLLWTPRTADQLLEHELYPTRYAVTVDTASPSPKPSFEYVTAVFTFDDEIPADQYLTPASSTEVEGVFMVHEHTTDTFFPVTSNSVIRWQSETGASFRFTQLDVLHQNNLRRELDEIGDLLDMDIPLNDTIVNYRIARCSELLRFAMNGADMSLFLPMPL